MSLTWKYNTSLSTYASLGRPKLNFASVTRVVLVFSFPPTLSLFRKWIPSSTPFDVIYFDCDIRYKYRAGSNAVYSGNLIQQRLGHPGSIVSVLLFTVCPLDVATVIHHNNLWYSSSFVFAKQDVGITNLWFLIFHVVGSAKVCSSQQQPQFHLCSKFFVFLLSSFLEQF